MRKQAHARASRLLASALTLFALLLTAACSSTKSSAFRSEDRAAVAQVLLESGDGDAALWAGQTTYWMYGKSVEAERAALMDAIRSTPYIDADRAPDDRTPTRPRIANVSRDAEVEIPANDQVITWVRPEVLEIACPSGTLHIERLTWFEKSNARFLIAVIRGSEFQLAGAKQHARIDHAWRRLVAAAQRDSVVMIQGAAEPLRPLESMRDIGIDFRGLSE